MSFSFSSLLLPRRLTELFVPSHAALTLRSIGIVLVEKLLRRRFALSLSLPLNKIHFDESVSQQEEPVTSDSTRVQSTYSLSTKNWWIVFRV